MIKKKKLNYPIQVQNVVFFLPFLSCLDRTLRDLFCPVVKNSQSLPLELAVVFIFAACVHVQN